MTSLIATWSAIDLRRRIVVVAATIAMFASVLGIARIAGAPSMALLYSGLDGAAAGEVITALEARGVPYAVSGESIRVPAELRDELRMILAADGLPAAATRGYELLENLSGFGTTAQMFDAAYWRAIEGEIARTILAVPGVRSARVHIARTSSDPFRTSARPTASVTVTMASGSIDPTQARALRHLVSAAVAGLEHEDVAVIDSLSGLVPTGSEEAGLPATAEGRAAALKANVERLLAARVGPGKAVVEVTVDLVTTREAVTERRFDPQGRVAISTETEERSDTSTGAPSGVTVASNLPDGDATPSAGDRSQSSETKERTNFEVSETQREILRLPGDIRRITVAVLVDGVAVPNPDGTAVWQPRPEDELQTLRELVGSAVGLDETRGDVLTLKSLPFETFTDAGSLADAGERGLLDGLDLTSVVQALVLAVVALVLGVFVLRPILSRGRQNLSVAPPSALALSAPDPRAAEGSVLTGEVDDGVTAVLAGTAQPEEDPVARLRRLIEERRAETVEVLRGWMERDGEKA